MTSTHTHPLTSAPNPDRYTLGKRFVPVSKFRQKHLAQPRRAPFEHASAASTPTSNNRIPTDTRWRKCLSPPPKRKLGENQIVSLQKFARAKKLRRYVSADYSWRGAAFFNSCCWHTLPDPPLVYTSPRPVYPNHTVHGRAHGHGTPYRFPITVHRSGRAA